jgi:hypothetical protein
MDFSKKKQISFFLLNEPGELDKLLAGLAEAEVNLVALSVADADPESVVRIVVDNASEELEEVLHEVGLEHFEIEDVFGIQIAAEPGKLMEITAALAGKNVNILNIYGSEEQGGKAIVYMHCEQVEVAEMTLASL